MKKLLLLFSGVFFSANILSCSLNKEPFKTYTFASPVASSIEHVEATTTNGKITLNGNAGSEAVVEMYVSSNRTGLRQASWSEEEIRQILEEEFTIEVNVEGEKLIAFAKPKNSKIQQKLSIAFSIRVPLRMNSNLHTSNASIQISNLAGSHNFKTSNGSVKVENVSGKISGSTSNGSIGVSNSDDDIDLKTSNGSVTVKDCNGAIALKTSNGGFNLTNINGRISISTSNGGVSANNINGELKIGTSNGSVKVEDISGSVDVKTSNGSIDIMMNSVSEFVKLSTTNAPVNIDLPAGNGYNLNVAAKNINTSGLQNFSGKVDSKNLNGTIADGGATIEIKTSGRANMSFK